MQPCARSTSRTLQCAALRPTRQARQASRSPRHFAACFHHPAPSYLAGNKAHSDSSEHLRLECIEALRETLTTNTCLRELSLRGNTLRARGVGVLAPALRFNSTLRSLVLSSCNLGAEGAAVLVESLSDNEGLTELELKSNALGRGTPLATRTFATCAASHPALLARLTLGPCSRADGTASLTALLSIPHPTLARLNISNNHIDANAVESMLHTLRGPHALTAVRCASPALRLAMHQWLRPCPGSSLPRPAQLSLASNSLGETGGRSIYSGLPNK